MEENHLPCCLECELISQQYCAASTSRKLSIVHSNRQAHVQQSKQWHRQNTRQAAGQEKFHRTAAVPAVLATGNPNSRAVTRLQQLGHPVEARCLLCGAVVHMAFFVVMGKGKMFCPDGRSRSSTGHLLLLPRPAKLQICSLSVWSTWHWCIRCSGPILPCCC